MIANEFNDCFVSFGDKFAGKILSNINPLSHSNAIPNSMVIIIIYLLLNKTYRALYSQINVL